MPRYKRVWRAGGTYFFTLTLNNRHNNDLLTRHIDSLRTVVNGVRERYPFEILAWVVLPEHMHFIIELPVDDADFAVRLRLIKMGFSKSIPKTERLTKSRESRGERGVWQRRYWEHLIRDDQDYQTHFDYVHFNPVKHGLAKRVVDWPYSTFHKYVRCEVYPSTWAADFVDRPHLPTADYGE
jgi:putative transposase